MTTELSIEKQQQKAALADMTPELREIYEEIKTKQESMVKNTVLSTYEVGELVARATTNKTKYGEAAVETLAAALGKHYTASDLYKYRALAKAYTREQIEKLVEQKTRGGGRISVTHLVKLAGQPAQKRRELTRAVFEEDLTTDELAMRIQGPREKKDSDGGRKPKPPKTISKGLKDIGDYCTGVRKRVNIWDQHVFRRIQKAPPELCDEDLLFQLEKTRKAEEKAIEDSQHIIEKLDDSIARVKRVLAQRKSGNGAAKKKPAKKAPVADNPPTKKAKKKVTKKKSVKKKTSRKTPVSAAERIAAAKARKGLPVEA